MRFVHRISVVVAAVLGAGLPGNFALAAAPAIPGATPAAPAIEGAVPLNNDPVESSRFLGPVYKMESEGFRMAPPAGSRIIERRGIDLVSYVVDAKSWGGSLQLLTLPNASMGMQEFLTNNTKELNKMFKGVQVLQQKALRVGGKPAVRFDLSMEGQLGGLVGAGAAQQMGLQNNPGGQAVALFRQQLIVQMKPDEFNKSNEFLILTLYAPLKDRVAAAQTFEMMLTQFELFDPVVMKKRRLDAVAVGKSWLADQTAENFRGKIINEPQMFRMLVGAQDVGYFRFDELTQEPNPRGGALIDVERDKHKGVLEVVNFRSFPDDGSVIYGQNEAFWGFSKSATGAALADYSTWSNVTKTKTRIPLPPGQVRPGMPAYQEVLPWVQETGILSQIGKPYQIIVALSGDPTQRLPSGINMVIPVEMAAPLPKIFEYTWTRFVDLTKPSEMTFSVFNSGTRKMALRTLIVTGTKESIKIDGKVVSCYKCIDELDPSSTTIWVDATGRVQMMRTSDQSVMVPTTDAAMRLKWGKRLSDQ